MEQQCDEVAVRDLMPADVADLYIPIHKDVLSHHAKWKIFRQLYAESEERIELLDNAAGSVFRYLQDLLFYDALLTFSILTEPSDRVSLRRLVEVLKKHVEPAFYEEVVADLDEIVEMCSDFITWRNKRIAHKDLGFFVGESLKKLPPVNRKMIEDANEKIGEMLNKIRTKFGVNYTLFTPWMTGDGDALISTLIMAVKTDPFLQTS
ncbi:MAG: hypothetical protein KAR65_04705 [Anaerolineales bacterium]|nr:hypothetical protein [Anaerolineales bacterium]